MESADRLSPVAPPRPAAPVPCGAPGPAPRVSSRSLLGGARELLIEHQQQVYRLRLTAQGKLILTK